MSMEEKYGNFSLKDVLFYDDMEREHFMEELMKGYRKFISKINGKKVIGHGKLNIKTPEERETLRILNMQLKVDEENNIVNLVGYGHRRLIFPIELWTRKLFDEGRIVSYEAADNLNRSIPFTDEEIDEDLRDFYAERKRRIEAFKKGELEPPKYREVKAKTL